MFDVVESSPFNPHRQNYRLAIAAQLHVCLWHLDSRDASLNIPLKAKLISASAHDISVKGMGVDLHRSDYESSPLNVGDFVGVLFEHAGERLVCHADVRYVNDYVDDVRRIGLGFEFNRADMEQRYLVHDLEKMVAVMNREMLRRRAFYETK